MPSKHNGGMFKRLIHEQSYDAGVVPVEPNNDIKSPFKNTFLSGSLGNVHLISILMSFLIFAVLAYATIEVTAQLQILQQELLVINGQIKKFRAQMHELAQQKTLTQPLNKSSNDEQKVAKEIEPPTHLKYMGLFKSGATQKVLIEMEQGGILFAQNQMIDQEWKLKKIHEDRLLLESITGQQVTIYKEPADE